LIGTGVAIIRLAGMVLFRIVFPLVRYNAPRILEDITVILAYFVWGGIRLRLAGMDLSGIVATSAIITAVVAFAMQDTLGNILGGLAIHLDHSVEIGDWVVLEGVSGKVTDIRWRYTKVITRNGEIAVLPNSLLMKNRFMVIGARGGEYHWRRWIWFGVDYQWSPGQVIHVVEQALGQAEIAHVARQPAPQCVLMEFAAGYGQYALRYWLTDPQQDDPTDSAVRQHVFAALQRAGMRIAVPEAVRHLVKENENHAQRLHAREMARRLTALRRIELFSGLSESELTALAERLVYSPFESGDVITRQGAVAHWLYILVAGEAEVWLEDGQGKAPRLITTLSPGSVFGEMGLMTGEPRFATVKARSAVECYRLDKAGFEDIIRARPEIAEGLSRILASGRQELEHILQNLEETPPEHQDHARFSAEILAKIKKFFSLSG
jgi:small-conductance mechanosensitive channel/CRP-like cAMP-binding protein